MRKCVYNLGFSINIHLTKTTVQYYLTFSRPKSRNNTHASRVLHTLS